VLIRGYSLHFFFVPEPVRRLVRRSASEVGSFCEGGWLCGYEIIMQNKPNLLDTKMNVSPVKLKSYEQITMNNEPIKTNPIKPKQTRSEAHRGACPS